MSGLEYRIIQLSNGTTVYTRDAYEMPSSNEHAPTWVTGLDGQRYNFLDNEVVFTAMSTVESRLELLRLKHALKMEEMEYTREKMMEMEKQMVEEQQRMQQGGKAESAAEALMRGARPVQLS